jgi:peptidoglycan/LPS O-acetylase OafA/YrhL
VSENPASERRLYSLQVLRAVAAVAVVFSHFQFDMARYVTQETGLPSLVVGNAGVDLFFVISGFVIVYASEHLHYTLERPLIAALRRFAKLNRSVTAVPRKQVAS